MFNDLVSIVITNYNYGKYLPRAIRSCLSQKHLNFEVVVVDDNSTDDSHEILESFSFLSQEKILYWIFSIESKNHFPSSFFISTKFVLKHNIIF